LTIDGYPDGDDVLPEEEYEEEEDQYYNAQKYPASPAIPMTIIAIVVPETVVVAAVAHVLALPLNKKVVGMKVLSLQEALHVCLMNSYGRNQEMMK